VLAIAALLAVPYLVDLPRVQALIVTNASQAVGRPVKFRSMSVAVLPLPAVELHGVEIAEDPQFGTEPFLRLDTGVIRLRLWPLLAGRVELGDISLKKPHITVITQRDGRMNIATLGGAGEARPTARAPRTSGGQSAAGASAAVLGSRVSIDDGVLTYVARGAGDTLTRYHVEDLDLALAGAGSQMTFTGEGRVRPGDVSVKVSDGVIALSGARSLMDSAVRAKITVDGKDITELVKAAAGDRATLGGGIKGTLTLAGTLGAPNASGDVELSKLTVTQVNPQCPEPKRRTLAIPAVKMNAAYDNGRLTGRPLTTSIGSGTVSTAVLVTLDRGVRVQMSDLGIKALPLDKVLVDFLCQGYAVTGPMDLTGALTFAAADVWNTLSGPGQLRIGPGKVVGSQALALVGGVVRLGGAVSALLSADLPRTIGTSPLEFDSIAGTYQVTNGVVTTRDLLYTSRAMKVAVAGDYALGSGRMNLDMVISTAKSEVKARVTGSAASPSVRVLPSSLLGDPKSVEKGLGDLLRRLR
jgi:AsmA protein